jgi:sulfur-carrier protein
VSVTVLYFAAVRDLVGIGEELVVLPPAVVTLGALAAHLTVLHPALAGRLECVRFARNEEFASLGDSVGDGDTVALIPPVAGG